MDKLDLEVTIEAIAGVIASLQNRINTLEQNRMSVNEFKKRCPAEKDNHGVMRQCWLDEGHSGHHKAQGSACEFSWPQDESNDVCTVCGPGSCGVCCGRPLNSNRKCICGGAGTLSAEADGLRKELLSWEIAAGLYSAIHPTHSDKHKYFRTRS